VQSNPYLTEAKLDFLDLFEKFHFELKIDFEKDLALYLVQLHDKAGGVITDLESFDQNMPPLTIKNSEQYHQH
jgi:hypothetical protein